MKSTILKFVLMIAIATLMVPFASAQDQDQNAITKLYLMSNIPTSDNVLKTYDQCVAAVTVTGLTPGATTTVQFSFTQHAHTKSMPTQTFTASAEGEIVAWQDFRVEAREGVSYEFFCSPDQDVLVGVLLNNHGTSGEVIDARGWQTRGYMLKISNTNENLSFGSLSVDYDPRYSQGDTQIVYADREFLLIGSTGSVAGVTDAPEPLYFIKRFANEAEMRAWSIDVDLMKNGMPRARLILFDDHVDHNGVKSEVSGMNDFIGFLFETSNTGK